jgi:hypothetical protein
LVAAIGENQFNEWQNGTIARFVNHNYAQSWHNPPTPANAALQATRDDLNPRYGANRRWRCGSRRESAVAFQIIYKNWPIRSVHPSGAW